MSRIIDRPAGRTMSVGTLLEGWCAFAPGAAEPAVRVAGLALDAASVRPGEAYCAVVDASEQGLRTAAARGAAAVLHDGAPAARGLGVPAIEVPGLEARLAELGARFHGHPAESLTLAGVAGYRGKTTVAHFLAQSWQRENGGAGALSDLGRGPLRGGSGRLQGACDGFALQGVLAQCAAHGVERMAIELSPRVLDDGARAACGFDALVFTGSTPGADDDWLPLIADSHPRFAVVNHDDAAGKSLSRRIANGTQVLTYGTNGATELRGSILAMDDAGMTIRIAGPWGGGEVRTGLLGAFNLANLLGAAGALALLGMPWNRVMHQVEIMQSAPGRLQALGGEPGRPSVVLDRAASPAELEHALTALRSHLHGRLVCVFGCAAATGREDRAALAAVAESLSDRVVMTAGDSAGENPWAIFEDMARGLRRLDDARVIADRAEAIRCAIEESRGGDIVLVAGRAGEYWPRVAGIDDDARAARCALEAAA